MQVSCNRDFKGSCIQWKLLYRKEMLYPPSMEFHSHPPPCLLINLLIFQFTEDNELITLEIIHQFVEILDKYFGNVCELDLIFNFHKAYFILDELLLAGELAEPSKRAVSRVVEAQDQLVEQAKLGVPQNNMPVIRGPRG